VNLKITLYTIKGFESMKYLGIGSIKSFLINDVLNKLKQLYVAMGQRTVGKKWFKYTDGLITQEVKIYAKTLSK
jgi:hypothetical protein